MTLVELCEDLDTLEKMSDDELRKYCEPYFTVTRPELAPRNTVRTPVIDPVAQFKAKKLAAMGIDVSYLFNKKKR